MDKLNKTIRHKAWRKRFTMFIGVSIAAIYLEYLAVALILYGAMRLFGGRGSVQATIAAFCFLAAYLPIAAVLRSPSVPIVDAAMKAGANYPEIVDRGFKLLAGMSRWDKTVFALAAVLSIGVYIFFLLNVYRALRWLHGMPRGRADLAYIVGLAAVQLFTALFVVPFDGAVARAFAAK